VHRLSERDGERIGGSGNIKPSYNFFNRIGQVEEYLHHPLLIRDIKSKRTPYRDAALLYCNEPSLLVQK
jgi:hypothetical protein